MNTQIRHLVCVCVPFSINRQDWTNAFLASFQRHYNCSKHAASVNIRPRYFVLFFSREKEIHAGQVQSHARARGIIIKARGYSLQL